MDENQYNEILARLERIENLLNPLAEDTSYQKKIISNLIGNLIWEWLYFGTSGSGLHPPKF